MNTGLLCLGKLYVPMALQGWGQPAKDHSRAQNVAPQQVTCILPEAEPWFQEEPFSFMLYKRHKAGLSSLAWGRPAQRQQGWVQV